MWLELVSDGMVVEFHFELGEDESLKVELVLSLAVESQQDEKLVLWCGVLFEKSL